MGRDLFFGIRQRNHVVKNVSGFCEHVIDFDFSLHQLFSFFFLVECLQFFQGFERLHALGRALAVFGIQATLFRLFDLDGNLKTMVAPRNNANPRMQASASRAFLRDGRSNVLLAPEGAHELVLFDGDRELAREPITLFPDVLHEIDLREASAMK